MSEDFERAVYCNRPFPQDFDIEAHGQGLLDASLPRAAWTHEGHIAATLWLIRARLDLLLDAELPGIIRRYNVRVGGENSDHAGYHHTLTIFYLTLLRRFAAQHDVESDLVTLTNVALSRPFTRRDYPAQHYSDGQLWSVAARRGWCAPDLLPMDQALL
jgi:hypothetical protein